MRLSGSSICIKLVNKGIVRVYYRVGNDKMKIILRGMILFLTIFLLVACSTEEEKNIQTTSLSSETVNILMIGIDSRGEDKSRSDAILVGQYDPKGKTLKMASFMRDSYVKIPTYEKGYHKLNTAYFLGGKELLAQTIKENFGIAVDHVVTIDFQGFVHVVDTIAPEGIEVEVTQAMIDDMHFDVEAGTHFLKGKDLLKYVRFRHDSESDFGRVKRQQEVLVKLREHLSNEMNSIQHFASLPKLVEGAFHYIESDLSLSETIALASKVLLYQVDQIETLTIPVENGFENKIYDHAGAVLQLDAAKNMEALDQFFQHQTEVNN